MSKLEEIISCESRGFFSVKKIGGKFDLVPIRNFADLDLGFEVTSEQEEVIAELRVRREAEGEGEGEGVGVM